jgi:hypothetical protein
MASDDRYDDDMPFLVDTNVPRHLLDAVMNILQARNVNPYTYVRNHYGDLTLQAANTIVNNYNGRL